MTTLSELLIQANINPSIFSEDVEYIAHDEIKTIFLYANKPTLLNGAYLFAHPHHFVYFCTLSSDWKTPLHIDAYKQAWNNSKMKEAHVMTIPFTYPCLMQCTEQGEDFVVEFSDKYNSIIVYSAEYPEDVGCCQKWRVYLCENIDHWEPYTGTKFKLSTHKGEITMQENACFDEEEWLPYAEATQTPSVELLSTKAILTPLELLERLEELKTSLNAISKHVGDLVEKRASITTEYLELKDQLLAII